MPLDPRRPFGLLGTTPTMARFIEETIE